MYNNDYPEEDWNDNTPKIRVVIRKRPLGKKELQKGDGDIVDTRGPQTVVVRETKSLFLPSNTFLIFLSCLGSR